MKKVFKASLVATTIALAFAANAADVAIAPVTTVTNEAVLTKTVIPAATATITIYNRQELSAGDKVTLSFPLGTVLAAGDVITINKGAATASFTAPVVTGATATVGPKITYELALGNPLLANSKIDVVLPATYVPASGNVVYEAKDGFTGTVKDTTGSGTGTPNQAALIKTQAQEVVSLKTEFDGFVQRLARNLFVDTKGSAVSTTAAKAVLSVQQPTATVTAAIVANQDLVVLKADGSLAGLASVAISDGTNTVTVPAANFTASNPAAPTVLDTATFDVSAGAPAALVAGTATAADWTITATAAAAPATIPLRTFTVTRKVTYDGVAPTADHVSTTAFAAGEFQLDATLVNVPYLPVGYEQFSSTVEISNLSAADAEVSVEAVGKTGKKYGPVVLSKKAAKGAVTSFFESDFFTAFGLAKGSNEKLSISFAIDANEKDITVVPYYREGTARVNVIADQYKK
ncbi:hypothetical protein ACFO3I_17660 [Rheinheimera marina]|uniref:Uncharacterized protein n=1 Tax=Rheinheimera marina TaxID=1774958 RepID=A0ABV9JRS5_9GAMM